MRALSTALILIVGLVNLIPVSGVASAARLDTLYGMAFEDPNLVILMRHRALLFAIVGGLLVAGALHAPLRRIGLVVGLASMLSFVVIAWLVGSYNGEIARVIQVDVIASIALGIAWAADAAVSGTFRRSSGRSVVESDDG